MKYVKIFTLCCCLLGSGESGWAQGAPTPSSPELLSYVDPYIGSGYHGHVFVGTSVPYGMVQLGPNNIHKGWDWCSGYHHSDSILIGFSHTHLSGTGCTDLGDILLMPLNEIRTPVAIKTTYVTDMPPAIHTRTKWSDRNTIHFSSTATKLKPN